MGPNTCLYLAIFCVTWSQLLPTISGKRCPRPRLPRHSQIISQPTPPGSLEGFPESSLVKFECDAGYTLFGTGNATCSNGQWLRHDTECLLEVAEGNACQITSQADEYAGADLAADGDPRTCFSFDSHEKTVVWSVDTFQVYRVRVVTILSEHLLPNSTIEIRVGSHFPSTGAKFNKLCTRQSIGQVTEKKLQFLCEDHAAMGRYVSIAIEEPGQHRVSFCEVNVYSDWGLSVEDSCSSDPPLPSGTMRHVFKNQCIRFLGENTFASASSLCKSYGGTLVMPISRVFQNFIDFKVMRFVEKSFEQLVVSFWVNANRVNDSTWIDGNGTEIKGIQMTNKHPNGKCLVSEQKSWRPGACQGIHQTICVSNPVSCGSPSLPQHSAISERTNLGVDLSMAFNCEAGFRANLDSIKCLPEGTFSGEATCTAEGQIGFVEKAQSFLSSFRMFANFSAAALRAIIALIGALLAALTSALLWCSFCALRRVRISKLQTSKANQWSLTSFSVHMKDLPVTDSSRIFKSPVVEEKTSSPSAREESDPNA
ncbi:uncharacterized protein LOC100901831 [Galendromus occidentalis]|uniref:Uncharacterized protein LOC100901831 n=1 Tax=Galendromus occidentalis TaxID=34638 RepID=A0AAJ6VXL1_9ACAR|nr:uncharacterized protein LOC100901831 [Galendromus occidentalis]